MLKNKWIPVLTTGALIGVLGFAGPTASAEDKPTSWPAFRIQKASDLIGKSVENPRGETLGEVQDLAIDAERGRIVYAVLSFGGFLGMAKSGSPSRSGRSRSPMIANILCSRWKRTV